MEITGTVNTTTKQIAIAESLAANEVREITIVDTLENMPAGTYRLVLSYGGRVMAVSALALESGELSGTLNLATAQIAAVFAVLPLNRIRPVCAIWDSAGKMLAGRSHVDLFRNEGDTTSGVDVVAVEGSVTSGTADITIGAYSVAVDMSSFSPNPTSSIVGTVLLPAGATEGMTVQGYSRSGDVVTFQFQSAAPSDGYKLNWMAAQ